MLDFDDDLPGFLSYDRIDRIRLIWRAILFAAIVIALFFAGVRMASAQDGPPRWLVNGAIAAQGTSFVTEMYATEACLQRGACTEQNPLVPEGTTKGDTLTRGLMKAGAATLSTWALLRTRDAHPVWTIVVATGITIGNGYLTARALDRYDPPRRR